MDQARTDAALKTLASLMLHARGLAQRVRQKSASLAQRLFYEDWPARRLRVGAFLSAAVLGFGLAALATLSFGSLALVRLDPLRVLARPLALPSPAELRARNEAFDGLARTADWRAQLLGLKAAASVLQRPPKELEPLVEGAAKLDEIASRQRTQAQSLKDRRGLEELKKLATEAETSTADSARNFAVLLAQGLRESIRMDAQRVSELQREGWMLDSSGILSALAAARAPLTALEQQARSIDTAGQAISLAQQVACIGQGLMRVSAPLHRTERALAARQSFAEIDSQVLSLIAALQEQAEDRPWFLASDDRREAFRQARARWAQVAPLAAELADVRALAFGSRDPGTIEAAVLRAYALRTSIQEVLAEPTQFNSEPPQPAVSQALQEARAQIQRASADAAARYRQVFDQSEPFLRAEHRRRRDRRAAQALRAELADMYSRVQQFDALERSANETETIPTAERAAADAQRLLRRVEEDERAIAARLRQFQ